MSELLTKIKQTLEIRQDIEIVKVNDRENMLHLIGNDTNYKSSRVLHNINFVIAPKNGLYTIDELQTFMYSLFPDDPKPTERHNFKKMDNIEVEFGLLYFKENIGEEEITITKEFTFNDELYPMTYATEYGIKNTDKWIFEDKKKVKLYRDIAVILYPDKTIAEHIYPAISYINGKNYNVIAGYMWHYPESIDQNLRKLFSEEERRDKNDK